ncbi:PA1414 family protein [Pseudomonas citronellolis]|nr:PA1414 family protein [Pseudomonas citronellolis]MDN6876061.1 PA1414 family protein [Pseudomonas citronellolis]
MKLWLQTLAWKLGVTLGLIEPPRLQPIPIPSDEQRRHAQQRRR